MALARAAELGPVLMEAQVLDTALVLVSGPAAVSAAEYIKLEAEYRRRKKFQRPIPSTPKKHAERKHRALALYG
jgi:hypothetical protein